MPTSDVEELLAERGLDVSYETVRPDLNSALEKVE
jgi:transposase-like protein